MKKKFETIQRGEYELISDLTNVKDLSESVLIEELLDHVYVEWDESHDAGCSGDYHTPSQPAETIPTNIRLYFANFIVVPEGALYDRLFESIYDKLNQDY